MTLNIGDLVSRRRHTRPQAIRHGVVKEVKGKYALVKFHGGVQPQRILITELQPTQQ